MIENIKEKIPCLKIQSTHIHVKNVVQHLKVRWSGNSIIAKYIPGTPVRIAVNASMEKMNSRRTSSSCIPSFKKLHVKFAGRVGNLTVIDTKGFRGLSYLYAPKPTRPSDYLLSQHQCAQAPNLSAKLGNLSQTGDRGKMQSHGT